MTCFVKTEIHQFFPNLSPTILDDQGCLIRFLKKLVNEIILKKV